MFYAAVVLKYILLNHELCLYLDVNQSCNRACYNILIKRYVDTVIVQP